MCLMFEHCWCLFFFENFDEIPIKLENAQCILDLVKTFSIAFCPSNKSADTFSDNSVEVFDIRRFYVFYFRIAEDYPSDFSDETTVFFDLDELTIINAVFPDKFWHNVLIIVIAVAKNVKTVTECWWCYTLYYFFPHRTTRILSPFTDGKSYPEVGFTLDTCVRPRFTLASPFFARALNFLLFFFTVVHNSSTS